VHQAELQRIDLCRMGKFSNNVISLIIAARVMVTRLCDKNVGIVFLSQTPLEKWAAGASPR
jgi:hypothetical protein